MKKKIKVENLFKQFSNKTILNNLNLNIFESESLAIIGESGSGKSVLTRCIIGLINFDSGTIKYENINNIKNLSAVEKNRYMSKFGVLFQNIALLDSLTILENLQLAKKQKSYLSNIDAVALPQSVLKKFPSELSVGVQKRIGIARAILKEPDILILDEPTTGLDPIIARQINILIKNLVKEQNLTTITVTHDMESVYEFADKTAFIKHGKIQWYGYAKNVHVSKNKELEKFIYGKE